MRPMGRKRALLTTLAVLLTLLLIAVAAAAPYFWFQAQDERQLAQPLERRRQGGHLAPEGEDLYMVRTLHARHERLLEEGVAAGFQAVPTLPEDLRPALAARLDAIAKAGVLPAALASQLSVLLEQQDTRFTLSADGAGFEQVQCIFQTGPYSVFGLEYEPLTGLAVNLWLGINPGEEGAGLAEAFADAEVFAEDAPASESIVLHAPSPSSLPEEAAGAAGGVLRGRDAQTLLRNYCGWLELDGLDDWAAAESGTYAALLVSEKAQLQLHLMVRDDLLTLGAAPLGGHIGTG